MLHSRFKNVFLLTVLVFSTFLVINNSNLNALDIDIQAPSLPTITTNPTYTEGSWTNKSIIVTASGSTDNVTAPENIKYEISTDGVVYTIGKNITLSQTGNHTVYFKVTDEAENSGITNKSIKIDLVIPSMPNIIMTAGDSGYAGNTWVNKALKIKLSGAIDTGGSAISGYQYKIGEGAWINGDVYTFNASGDYIIYFRSLDNAGNISATDLRNIKVDLEGPRAFPLQTNITTIDSIYITCLTVDDLSGMAPVAYRVHDGKVWSNWKSKVEDWLTGYERGQEVTLTVEARDNAGNITTSQAKVKTLTNTLPVAVKDSFNIKSNAEKTPLDILKNDYDDDKNDGIKLVAISEISNPLAGKIYLENGIVSFEPSENFGGTVTFEYTIEDGFGGKSNGIVEIAVTAIIETVEEPIVKGKKTITEPFFTDICIVGLVIGSILVLINYIIHRRFFNNKPMRIILYALSSITVFLLLCLLRISMGYIFSFLIMIIYIVTAYMYAAWGASKK